MGDMREPSLAGIAVNERLSYIGIIDRWDEAGRRRDRETMIALLEQVEVPDLHLTADTVLADPKRNGFWRDRPSALDDCLIQALYKPI